MINISFFKKHPTQYPLALHVALLCGLLLLVVAFSLCLGRYAFSWDEILRWIQGGLPQERSALLAHLLFSIRLPRILAAVLVGAALAASGTAFQALFINPLVSPGLLGVLAGAAFGAALGMLYALPLPHIQALAFLFGVVAVLLAIALIRQRARRSRVMLVLGGIISGAFFTALLSLVKYVADPENELPAIVYFLMGSLAQVTAQATLWAGIGMLCGMLGLFAYGRQLNALSMGSDEAHCLGVRVEHTQLIIIGLATLASALTVVVGGVIGWVGLIVPQQERIRGISFISTGRIY